MKKHLPNLFTCLNLFTGCIAVVMVFRNHLDWAAYLIFIAAFFDLLDGLTARMMNLFSPFGKELDSLADMISFGFIPGAIMFKLFQQSDFMSWPVPHSVLRLIQFAPFILTVFSALRLAKFNLDTRQTSSFIGLPTPANTLLIVSLPLIIMQSDHADGLLLLNPFFLLILTGILSFLLVSEIPMFSLKAKSLKWKGNELRFTFLGLFFLLLVLLNITAFPLILLIYIIWSAISSFSAKKPLS